MTKLILTTIGRSALVLLTSLGALAFCPEGFAASAQAEIAGPLSGTATLDLEERTFLSLVNAHRALNGRPALEASVRLTQAADWMSTDMAARNYFSHTDLDGRSAFERMKAFGYVRFTSASENIAAGNSTAAATFNQWKKSPGHNANMLSSRSRAIGIARAYDPSARYRWYWTTDFGSTVDEVAK